LLFAAAGCAHARWPAKTLSDGVPIASVPIEGTVAQLRALPRPPGVDAFDAPRVQLERQVYTVRAQLLRFTFSPDGDIHLAIADPNDPQATMIAEIPDPRHMTGAPRRYRYEVATTRRAFVRAFGPPMLNAWHEVHREVVITGPIFFDIPRGQIGGRAAGAPNAIEIHPVLRIETPTSGSGRSASQLNKGKIPTGHAL
jgi:hypothetical protein